MARSLKFCIKVVEGLYYLCSENKGADQLRGYREADLRLCFRICQNPVFSLCGSNMDVCLVWSEPSGSKQMLESNIYRRISLMDMRSIFIGVRLYIHFFFLCHIFGN